MRETIMHDGDMLLSQPPPPPPPSATRTDTLPVTEHVLVTSPKSERPRKRVTFDMDIQVHTIPNRIPSYERRPAFNSQNPPHYGTLFSRTQTNKGLMPRPLDQRNRDRYIIGAANLSAKRIIDLFGMPNHSTSPSRNSTRTSYGTHRSSRIGSSSAHSVLGRSPPNPPSLVVNKSLETGQPKMSRAAASLKEITDALGETSYKGYATESWDCMSSDTEVAKLPSPGYSERIRDDVETSSVHSGYSSYSSRMRNPSPSASPAKIQTFSFSDVNNITGVPTPIIKQSFSPERIRSGSLTTSRLGVSHTSPTRRKASVSNEQLHLSSRSLITAKMPTSPKYEIKKPQVGKFEYDLSRDENNNSEINSTDSDKDRPPSRCSTIDTYVISGDPQTYPATGPIQSAIDRVMSPTESLSGPYKRVGSGTSGLGPRKGVMTPSGRPMAWEGLEIPVARPSLQVSALRTAGGIPKVSNLSTQYTTASGSYGKWYKP